MKYHKRGVTLTMEEWIALSGIVDYVLPIMEREGEDMWRDGQSILMTLTDEEMKMICDLTGSDRYKLSIDGDYNSDETTSKGEIQAAEIVEDIENNQSDTI